MQGLDLGAHLHAQLGVEIAEGLVEEEDLGIAHDGPAHGDALALAAGELAGKAVQQRLQAQDADGRPPRRSIRCLAGAAQRRPKAMLSRVVIWG